MIAPVETVEDRWIETISGIAFYPLKPRAGDIIIEDIGWALSMQVRFSGHVKQFYSVAERCVHVANSLPKEYALWGLLHDASEAYLVDLPSPIKAAMPIYKRYENQLLCVVAERFGLPFPLPDIVKSHDQRLLFNEKAVILNKGEREWSWSLEPLPDVEIQCWSPNEAYEQFMDKYDELQNYHIFGI